MTSANYAPLTKLRAKLIALLTIALIAGGVGAASPALAAVPTNLTITGDGTDNITINYSGGSLGADYLIFCNISQNPCNIDSGFTNFGAVDNVVSGQTFAAGQATLNWATYTTLAPGSYAFVIRQAGTSAYSNTVVACVGASACTPSHTVTFHGNGGIGSMPNQVANSATNLTGVNYVYAGHTFAGWNTQQNGQGQTYADLASYNFSADIDLWAQWTPLARTVEFNANGGSGSMADQSSGAAADLTASTLTRSGYMFMGWNTAANGSGTAYDDEAEFAFSANTELFAQWKAIPSSPTSSVEIGVSTGAAIDNAPVDVVVEGLKNNSSYKVTVRSTPIVVAQGRIYNSRLDMTFDIPANLEPGWHSITVEGTAVDGSEFVDVMYFEVSSSGRLADATDKKSKTNLPATAAELRSVSKKIAKFNVGFNRGAVTLSKADRLALRKLAKASKAYNLKVVVTGSAGYLEDTPTRIVSLLAKKRANLMKKYLIKQGVKPSLITTKLVLVPFGSSVNSGVKLKVG